MRSFLLFLVLSVSNAAHSQPHSAQQLIKVEGFPKEIAGIVLSRLDELDYVPSTYRSAQRQLVFEKGGCSCNFGLPFNTTACAAEVRLYRLVPGLDWTLERIMPGEAAASGCAGDLSDLALQRAVLDALKAMPAADGFRVSL